MEFDDNEVSFLSYGSCSEDSHGNILSSTANKKRKLEDYYGDDPEWASEVAGWGEAQAAVIAADKQEMAAAAAAAIDAGLDKKERKSYREFIEEIRERERQDIAEYEYNIRNNTNY